MVLRRRRTAIFVAIAAVALLFARLHASERRATAVVEGGSIADRVVGRCVVDPKRGVAKVRSLVDARVLRVLARVGDEVDAGQLLAELDPSTFAAELALREAEKRAASASAGSVAEAARPEEQAALEAAAQAARAEAEYADQRAAEDERLFATGGLPSSARDASREQAKVKRALLEQAESRLRLARSGGRASEVLAARARASAAEAAERQAQQWLERTRLVSPIRGRVLVRRVDPGDTILNLPNAAPLFEIADVTETEVRAEIEESEAPRLAPGQGVTVTMPGGAPVVGHGRIDRMSPRLERRSIDADDARVRAEGLVRVAWLAWDGAEAPALALGQHLDCTIALGERAAAALVPRAAVRVRDGRATVEVPAGLWTSERVVELGAADESKVEVRGIDAGARVLLP
ncbi:MAG: efflux RND transporter periplasmic adaptor subunit [Myxococcales bacterium]|nr:efflux RND transporter periplasmic adaptor subunit [Myxococcales bacterium]